MRRRTTHRLLTAALALLAGLVFLCLLSPGPAGAYPNGWTVQRRLAPDGALNCDMDAYHSYVCLAWQRADGAIAVRCSSDAGATWSGGFVVEDGTYDNGPPVVVYGSPANQCVYIIWAGKRAGGGSYRTWVARSNDMGMTFPMSSRWHSTGSGNRTEQDACLVRSTNEVIWTYTSDAGGSDEVYWGKISAGGAVSEKGRLSSADGVDSHQAVVAARAGAGAMAVWTEEAGIYNRRHLVCSRTADEVKWGAGGSGRLPHSSSWRLRFPSASWTERRVVVACQVQRVSDGRYFFGRYYFDPSRSAWNPGSAEQSVQVDTGAVPTCPETVGPSSGDCFFKNRGGTLSVWDGVKDFLGDRTTASGAHSVTLASADPGHDDATHYAAAATTGGEVYFRREDTRPTAAGLTAPAFKSGTFITNADFPVKCTGAADDFPASGTDVASGKRFSNGFEGVSYFYTNNEATWSPLPCRGGGNVATTAPFRRTVDTRRLNRRNIKIRTISVDSAGNVADWISPWVVIDRDPPVTAVRRSGTEGEHGFYLSDVSASLSADDWTPTNTFYRLENMAAGRGDSGWRRYREPLRLREGRWRLRFYSVDRAGNREREKACEVLIDRTPPVPAVTRPVKDVIRTGFSSPDSFKLAGTATDENGLCRSGIYVDGVLKQQAGGSSHITYNWNLEGVSEGNHKITVNACDPAGNRGAASKTVYVGNTARDWYFAEGNTLPEFDEFLCVLNPGDAPVRYRISFMLETGEVRAFSRTMTAHQRDTVRVKDYIGEPHGGVSVKIHSDDRAIIAERPMYFLYKAHDPHHRWKGGHDVMGINVLQNQWYFAEGTTRSNQSDGAFEEWLCLQNPSQARTADAVVTYMLGSGRNVRKTYAVPPHSRVTVDVAGDIGLDQDVSVKVTSNVPIAAERPMYFDYHGYAVDGSDVVGASGPSNYWSFAEGCTRAGFQEWLTIQNPGNVAATCRINHMTGRGRMTQVVRRVGPRSRATVDVLSQVGDNQDVSTTISSDVPVIAERPMYFIYGMESGKNWDGGECVPGNPSPSATYLLAEGTTIPRFDTFYTLANPTARVCDVAVRYMFTDGSTKRGRYRIEAHSRLTINVRDAVGRLGDVSGYIAAPFPIVVERPMYFQYNKAITGGHGVNGYGID